MVIGEEISYLSPYYVGFHRIQCSLISISASTQSYGMSLSIADDIQLDFSVLGKLNNAVDVISQCLKSVGICLGNHRFQLNPSSGRPTNSGIMPSLVLDGDCTAPNRLGAQLEDLLGLVTPAQSTVCRCD